MAVCQFGCFAPARSAFDESLFDEVRLIDILYRACVFSHRRSNRIESDRSAAELVDDGQKQFIINLVESEGIYIKRLQRIARYLQINRTVPFDLRKIAYTPQKRIGYTGRTARRISAS